MQANLQTALPGESSRGAGERGLGRGFTLSVAHPRATSPEWERLFSTAANKKPSPVGEGGSRRLTDEVFLYQNNSSSTANAVPLLPQEKALWNAGELTKGSPFVPRISVAAYPDGVVR